VATELPLRYRKLVANPSRCYVIVAGLWAGALTTFIAPLLTKPDWFYYRYNVDQKMCGLHWEYPSHGHYGHRRHQCHRNYWLHPQQKHGEREEEMIRQVEVGSVEVKGQQMIRMQKRKRL